MSSSWQSARSLGDWTLVGCTVAPGFDFSQFELAEPGWEPGVTAYENVRDQRAQARCLDHEMQVRGPHR